MSEPTQPYDVIQQCAKTREEAAARAQSMTIADAIGWAQWLRRTPDGMLDPRVSAKVIDTLLAAIESSPCFFKGVTHGIPTFTLLAYDRAAQDALLIWIARARGHGCREEKLADAVKMYHEWRARPDCRWPT